MSLTYVRASGAFSRNGELLATGYSGFGAAKNDPGSEAMVNVGPVPRGRYDIGEPFDSETHGPICFHLSPEAGTKTYGRCGFLIHGDSILHPGSASHGCIILDRPARLAILASGDRDLEVI